jgi:hypothetical protein
MSDPDRITGEEAASQGRLFDMARKAVSGSVKTVLSTEEGIKAVLGAVVPKEVGQYIGRELSAFRTDFSKAMVGELSRFLNRLDPAAELQKVLAGLTFDVHVTVGISKKKEDRPVAAPAVAPAPVPEPAPVAAPVHKRAPRAKKR